MRLIFFAVLRSKGKHCAELFISAAFFGANRAAAAQFAPLFRVEDDVVVVVVVVVVVLLVLLSAERDFPVTA